MQKNNFSSLERIRLEFRRLVRKYGVDLCFTPMTMTDSFCQSEKARQVEFSTSQGWFDMECFKVKILILISSNYIFQTTLQ